ncbi:MAG: methanol--corrinoid methyltransferase [Chitinivibrionales bacterium]|nr:methanol--corrinoid methyltransferase [Chitinivibrionales bacterium]
MADFTALTIDNPNELIFGSAPNPVTTRRGMHIGGGEVYPELNFTLPSIEVCTETLGEITAMYRTVVDEVCKRAVELHVPGLVIEFETLIEMTLQPEYAIELTKVMNDVLESYFVRHQLKSALRITPNDTRDKNRPPLMRESELLDKMLYTFEHCARNGAEMLSIESTGGKEVHDDALVECNIEKVIFGLAVLGVRDMQYLWQRIVRIAEQTGAPAAGDTACGFANTAMVLAEKKFIPAVFAAVVRAATIARSLVAFECGAVGPGKDCGYENPFLKAITGLPMSMEGKTAACAHLSPLGNIAAACCDLWSNESIQNIKLLGGMAPTIYLEQLAYDCRLMNQSTRDGQQRQLRDMFVRSDAALDPQALILAPKNVVRIAAATIAQPDHYRRTVVAAKEALAIIREAHEANAVLLAEMDVPWLEMLAASLAALPGSADAFIESQLPMLDTTKFRAQDYGL